MDEKKRKPGFTYFWSETLKQEIAMNDKTGKVYCEDGTVYTPEEIKVIQQHHGELPLCIHILKNKFKGEVIDDRQGNNRASGTKPDNTNKPTNNPAPTQTNNTKMQGKEPGLFDIY